MDLVINTIKDQVRVSPIKSINESITKGLVDQRLSDNSSGIVLSIPFIEFKNRFRML